MIPFMCHSGKADVVAQLGVGERGICTREFWENCGGEYRTLYICQKTINHKVWNSLHMNFLKISQSECVWEGGERWNKNCDKCI